MVLPPGWVGGAYAAEGPETAKIRFGIIALTDCSSIVMAHELGLFKKHGIESTISKEASWAVIRDRLTLGENQATHMLFGMPFASTMGLLGSPKKNMVIPFALNRNGQAITLKKELLSKGIKTPQAIKPLVADFVEVISRRGKAMVQVRVTEEITTGICFMPFHWGRQHGFYKAANNLTITARDPVSRQPELKACAVKVRKVLDFPQGDT